MSRTGLQPGTAVTVGFSGGSGIGYGTRLVEVLLHAGHPVHLCATSAAFRVLRHEAGVTGAPGVATLGALFGDHPLLRLHDAAAVDAAPASGSAGVTATVVCPCSMGTLARIAHGFSSNLIERAADVALKERRRLVVVPRETPLGEVHLENMLKLRRLGAEVLPAMPGFYHRPQTIADLIDFVVAKVLDVLGVEHALVRRWQTPAEPPPASPFHEGEE
ncbi:MAG: UbiX family flavin prenyltransferase [Planctomycetes bacterium]|nr:UbiX family flavin prenyltransferase [Planctomycetota bacterium]